MLDNIIKEYLVNTAGVDPEKFTQPDLTVADLQLDVLRRRVAPSASP